MSKKTAIDGITPYAIRKVQDNNMQLSLVSWIRLWIDASIEKRQKGEVF